MIRRLRIRMTILVVAVLVVVSAGIIFSINYLNWKNIQSEAEDALETLIANSGSRPPLKKDTPPGEDRSEEETDLTESEEDPGKGVTSDGTGGTAEGGSDPGGSASEGSIPGTLEGAVPEGTVPEGDASGEIAPEGTAPEGIAPEGTTPEGTAPDGTSQEGSSLKEDAAGGPAQSDPGQSAAGQTGASQEGTAQPESAQAGNGQEEAAQPGAGQTGNGQEEASQPGAGQTGNTQEGSAGLNAGQAGDVPEGSAPSGTGQTGNAQGGTAPSGADQGVSGTPGSAQGSMGQEGAGPGGSGQGGSGQGGPGQIGAGLVRRQDSGYRQVSASLTSVNVRQVSSEEDGGSSAGPEGEDGGSSAGPEGEDSGSSTGPEGEGGGENGHGPGDESERPKEPPEGQRISPNPGQPLDTEDALASLSNYYAVTLSSDDEIKSWTSDRSDLYTDGQVRDMTALVLESGKTSGRIGTQFYRIATLQGQKLLIVLDARLDILSAQRVMRTTVLIATIACLLLCIAAYFLIRAMVRPVQESFDRQRQFVWDASHELKTPLAVIGANADVLRGEIGDNEYLGYIRSEVSRTDKLVQNLLMLARMDQGTVKAELAPIDLGNTVLSVALPFESTAFEEQKKYDLQIPEGIICQGDPDMLAQLTVILLGNAFKYCDAHGEICVEVKKRGKSGAEIRVSNTGGGISPRDMDRIFDRFYRGDQSHNRDVEGHGLGLSIAKKIVEEHHGKIKVYNEAGGRTVFAVILP